MSQQPAPSPLSNDVKTLTRGSATYLIPTLVTRGLNFALAPVYTRYMSPDDYGIVGVTTTLVPMIGLFLGLSMHSAPSRLYYSSPDDATRARLNGTVLTFLLVVPTVFALGIELLGSNGLIAPLQSVPYSPYLRLALWSGVLVLLPNVALNMLVVREEHRVAALFNTVMVLATAGLTVLMVVVLKRGAAGQLTALLISNGLLTIPAIIVMWRIGRPTVDRALLWQALTFSLPLILHEASKWMLGASDRIILERSVPTADLGRYALGYTFGSSVSIIVTAVSNAFFPLVHRKLSEGDPRHEVPSLGNVVIFVSAFVALGVAVVFPPLLKAITPESYTGAGAVIPWVALGFFFQALYMVWSQGTFFSRRTGGIALVTLLGAGVNIGLNLWLVPRYGYLAAAVNTAVGFGIMAICHAVFAQHVFPIGWEFGRVARTIAAALGAFAAAVLLPLPFGPLVETLVRGTVAAAVYLPVLVILGGARPEEIAQLKALVFRQKPSPS